MAVSPILLTSCAGAAAQPGVSTTTTDTMRKRPRCHTCGNPMAGHRRSDGRLVCPDQGIGEKELHELGYQHAVVEQVEQQQHAVNGFQNHLDNAVGDEMWGIRIKTRLSASPSLVSPPPTPPPFVGNNGMCHQLVPQRPLDIPDAGPWHWRNPNWVESGEPHTQQLLNYHHSQQQQQQQQQHPRLVSQRCTYEAKMVVGVSRKDGDAASVVSTVLVDEKGNPVEECKGRLPPRAPAERNIQRTAIKVPSPANGSKWLQPRSTNGPQEGPSNLQVVHGQEGEGEGDEQFETETNASFSSRLIDYIARTDKRVLRIIGTRRGHEGAALRVQEAAKARGVHSGMIHLPSEDGSSVGLGSNSGGLGRSGSLKRDFSWWMVLGRDENAVNQIVGAQREHGGGQVLMPGVVRDLKTEGPRITTFLQLILAGFVGGLVAVYGLTLV